MGCVTFRNTSAIIAAMGRRYALNSSSGHVSITWRMDSFRIAEHCLIAASTSRAVSLLESMVGGSELTVWLGQSHWYKDKEPSLLFQSGYLLLQLGSRTDKVGQSAHCARQSPAANSQAPEIISAT